MCTLITIHQAKFISEEPDIRTYFEAPMVKLEPFVKIIGNGPVLAIPVSSLTGWLEDVNIHFREITHIVQIYSNTPELPRRQFQISADPLKPLYYHYLAKALHEIGSTITNVTTVQEPFAERITAIQSKVS